VSTPIADGKVPPSWFWNIFIETILPPVQLTPTGRPWAFHTQPQGLLLADSLLQLPQLSPAVAIQIACQAEHSSVDSDADSPTHGLVESAKAMAKAMASVAIIAFGYGGYCWMDMV
jgi:hypothetical protein